jgi:regulator of CtrA degradation
MALVYAPLAGSMRLRIVRQSLACNDTGTGNRFIMASSIADDDTLQHVSLHGFTGSALFDRTFDEGMALVEETARYLDGKGRQEARDLPRKAALLYAGESMRVTTRLMQAASWLLVQRAVHEGEMAESDARDERYRLGSREICLGGGAANVESLPATLQDLLARSDNLYRRIARLDDVLFAEGAAEPPSSVKSQLDLLQQAFGRE